MLGSARPAPAKPKMIVARRPTLHGCTRQRGGIAAAEKQGTVEEVNKGCSQVDTREAGHTEAAPRQGGNLPGSTAELRPRSKYCSRNCSNKNARARHKARK